jgi:hypothetical protein
MIVQSLVGSIVNMITFKEIEYWNAHSYGNALKIRRSLMLSACVVLCLVTPMTNWALPLAFKFIKKDLLVRY